jgi:hypothetical protein
VAAVMAIAPVIVPPTISPTPVISVAAMAPYGTTIAVVAAGPAIAHMDHADI